MSGRLKSDAEYLAAALRELDEFLGISQPERSGSLASVLTPSPRVPPGWWYEPITREWVHESGARLDSLSLRSRGDLIAEVIAPSALAARSSETGE